MTLNRLIHRQQHLRLTVMVAFIIHPLLRHLNQPLIPPQPPLLIHPQDPPPLKDPVDIELPLLHRPAVQLVTRYGRVYEFKVILQPHHVPVAVGRRVELAGSVVAAAVPVLGKGVFHAVMIHPVRGVVVVVVVLVAPEVSLDDFSGLDAVAAAAVLAVSVALSLIYLFLSAGESVLAGFVRRFAVAECGAHVVAVRAGPWTFADKAFDVVLCEDSIINLMAPTSWLELS